MDSIFFTIRQLYIDRKECIENIIYNYKGFISSFKNNYDYSMTKGRENDKLSMYALQTYSLIMAAAQYIANSISSAELQTICSEKLGTYLLDLLNESSKYSDDSDNGIINEFSAIFNDAIRNKEIVFCTYSKDMLYSEHSNQIILKDDLILFKDEIFESYISPKMTFTKSLLHVINALDRNDILVKKKKNRYSQTVYDENGHSNRTDFIAIKAQEILDTDIIEFFMNNAYGSFFAEPTDLPCRFVPYITDNSGNIAGKKISETERENLHISITGQSGYGKTVLMPQLICSTHKMGDKIVVFDSSDSFTPDTLKRNLTDEYVEENVKFIKIETDKIPVDLLDISRYDNLPQKKNALLDILSSYAEHVTINQTSAIRKNLKYCIDYSGFDFEQLLNILNDYRSKDELEEIKSDGKRTEPKKREETPVDSSEYIDEKSGKAAKEAYAKLLPFFYDIHEYGMSKDTWEDILNDSKTVFIISMDNSANTMRGSNPIIDTLIQSLFCYQKNNDDRHLRIFIDEIQNEKIKESAPIAKVLREGRKYNMSLIFSTQITENTSATSNKLMNLADTCFFLHPTPKSRTSIKNLFDLDSAQMMILSNLKIGECFVKGSIYDKDKDCNKSALIKGKILLHFDSFPSNAEVSS